MFLSHVVHLSIFIKFTTYESCNHQNAISTDCANLTQWCARNSPTISHSTTCRCALVPLYPSLIRESHCGDFNYRLTFRLIQYPHNLNADRACALIITLATDIFMPEGNDKCLKNIPYQPSSKTILVSCAVLRVCFQAAGST